MAVPDKYVDYYQYKWQVYIPIRHTRKDQVLFYGTFLTVFVFFIWLFWRLNKLLGLTSYEFFLMNVIFAALEILILITFAIKIRTQKGFFIYDYSINSQGVYVDDDYFAFDDIDTEDLQLKLEELQEKIATIDLKETPIRLRLFKRGKVLLRFENNAQLKRVMVALSKYQKEN